MYVVKRSGVLAPVSFDKITARISKLSYGLNPDFCDPVRVAAGRGLSLRPLPPANRTMPSLAAPFMGRGSNAERLGGPAGTQV